MLRCEKCKTPLEYEGQECPNCHFRLVTLTETIMASEKNIPETLDERDQRLATSGPKPGFQVRKKNKSLYHGSLYEQITETQEIYRETGEETTVYRRINRADDLYGEVIKGPDGTIRKREGTTLHHHKGRGSAKWKKKDEK